MRWVLLIAFASISSYVSSAEYKPVDISSLVKDDNSIKVVSAQRSVSNAYDIFVAERNCIEIYTTKIYDLELDQCERSESQDNYKIGRHMYWRSGKNYFEISQGFDSWSRGSYLCNSEFTRVYKDGSYLHAQVESGSSIINNTYEELGFHVKGIYAVDATTAYVGDMLIRQGNIYFDGSGRLYQKDKKQGDGWKMSELVDAKFFPPKYSPTPEVDNCLGKSSVLTLVKSFVGQPNVNLLNVIKQDHYRPSASDFTRIIAGDASRMNRISNKYNTDLVTYFDKIKNDIPEYKTKYFEIECTTLGALRRSWMNSNYPVIEFKDPEQVLIRVGLINSRTKERFNLYFLPRDKEGYSFAIFFPDLINDPQ